MKRVDIKTGFLCNNNCRFCVQADNKCKGNRTTEEIRRDLEESRKRCEGIVFTGGEVTIRKDIFEIVSYAKELGYRTIQIQSNCRMCSNIPFLEKLIKAGANEFSPAIHGHTPELHDYLTRAEGSFYQTVKAIKNLRELNQTILTNTVVVKPNYRYLPNIARLLVRLGVNQFQFAFVHPMGNAYKYYNEMVPKMSLAAPYIHEGLQIGIDAGIRVMAEAMPYCMMGGYEDYISERVIPDTEIKTGTSFDNNYTLTRIKEGKAKFPQCKSCRYNTLCEGPWREYPERFGHKEFKPILDNMPKIGNLSLNSNKRPKITLLWTLYSPFFNGQTPPNLSIAYLSKILEKNNFEVQCIDCNLLVYDKWGYGDITVKNKEEILSRLIKETEKTDPDILAIGYWTEGISFIKKFVAIIKERNPNIKVVLGGPLTTFLPEKISSFIPEADYLVRGEGELTLLELVKNISKSQNTKTICGISYRDKKGQLVNNPDRPLIKDLDKLPILDFENFVYLGKHEGLNIMTSRGCPFNCSYCPSGNFCKGYRFHSPEYIIKQIKHLINLYGVRHVSFSDDNVLCNQDRVRKLFGIFASENLDCKLPISGRVDNLNKEILDILKKAKVPWLTIGVENILPKVLKYYNRTAYPKQYISNIPKVIGLLEDYGIGAAFSFVLGSPIETEGDMLKNVCLMKELSEKNFLIYASRVRLVPGSSFWEQYQAKKVNIFKVDNRSTGFPFDDPYLDIEWICPSKFAFENNHYSNEKFVEIVNNITKEIDKLKKS